MSKVEKLLTNVGGDEAYDVSPGSLKKKKKKKKDKKDKKGKKDDENTEEHDDEMIVKEKSKKKKKGKKKTEGDLSDALAASSLNATPKSPKKKKETIDSSTDFDSPIAMNFKLLASPGGSNRRRLDKISSKNYDKWGADYFRALLEEIRAKCERKLKINEKDKEAFIMKCHSFYHTWAEKQKNDQRLTELIEGKNSKNNKNGSQTTEQLVEAQTEYGKELDAALIQQKKGCIKSALNVFMGLDEESLNRIQEILVKGAIIAQSTPEKLAEFASKGKQNKKLLKRLFGDTQLMKEMLLHGGAVKYEYGEAIRIFVDCMEVDKSSKKKTGEKNKEDEEGEDFEDNEWSKVHRKIALACALELASPMYEFDTVTNVDPVARYKHFVEAHKAGELDPSFPYFSIWEMRQIVNCDAPNDQMSWCRNMVSSLISDGSNRVVKLKLYCSLSCDFFSPFFFRL
jgi:hypothetical protein